MQRRELIAGAGAMIALAAAARASAQETSTTFGLIGSFKAAPGRRAELTALLLEGSNAMPGCLSYVVTEDAADADTIWVTEVWRDKAAHDASLQLPQVRAAIARARPLIAGFGAQTITHPIAPDARR